MEGENWWAGSEVVDRTQFEVHARDFERNRHVGERYAK